jgi:predicted nuclease of predicted toxin-antitoxin system
MSLSFLCDAHIPPHLAIWLREHGHNAVALGDIGLQVADDQDIWAYAQARDLVIITKDKDFARMVSQQPGPCVLWVRIGNATNNILIRRFEARLDQVRAHFESGARVVELR